MRFSWVVHISLSNLQIQLKISVLECHTSITMNDYKASKFFPEVDNMDLGYHI